MQETSQSLGAEVKKKVTARYLESIASKVSVILLLVANIRQNVSSGHSSSCTGGGYTTIQKHHDELLGALANMGMLQLTAKVYSRDLITNEIKSIILSGKSTEFKEANILLSAIQEKVKTDPSAFDTFIEILRSEPAYEHLADVLQTSNFKT